MDRVFWNASIAVLWSAWLAYWIILSGQVKATRWREPLRSQLLYRVPVLIAAVLLLTGTAKSGPLAGHFLPQTALTGALGTAMVAMGIALMVWARRCLGSNWSSIVTLKQDHTLIRSGPYRAIRHPIYTGLLLAIAGTAMAFGAWRDLVAFGLALFGLLYKARVEEKRMLETFADYEPYRRETAALIPFIY
jgi:protein-S-isoprenylcysteine O-methyltransferase Ste14